MKKVFNATIASFLVTSWLSSSSPNGYAAVAEAAVNKEEVSKRTTARKVSDNNSLRHNIQRGLEEDVGCRSIVDVVCSSPDHVVLCAALEQTGLDDALSENGTVWTLFAPTDEAFKEAFANNDIRDTLDADTIKFLMYEGSAITFDELVCSDKIESYSGKDSRTKCRSKGAEKYQTGAGNIATDTMPMITASVESPDILCSGSILVLDGVLLPKAAPSDKQYQWDEDLEFGEVIDDTATGVSSDSMICGNPRLQPKNDPWKACDAIVFASRKTTGPAPPTSWGKDNCERSRNKALAVYDLTIIGGGIGSAYLANRLRFEKVSVGTVALFEKGENIGGRLQSGFQDGALGLPVRPLLDANNVGPPEYGGMRVSPIYPLIFGEVIKLWESVYKDQYPESKCDLEFCSVMENRVNCCKGLLVPMDVGNVHYHSTRTDLGEYLNNSSLTAENALYSPESGAKYSADIVKNYEEYSPYGQCILLIAGMEKYITENPDYEAPNAIEGFAEICSPSKCGFLEGMCGLCGLFPEGKEALAAKSCTGYDVDPTAESMKSLIAFGSEVVNLANNVYLYIFSIGYQRFAQSLLDGTAYEGSDGYSTVAVSPQFQKKLVAVGVGPGDFDAAVDRARVLAQRQVDRFMHGDENVENDDDGSTGPIQLKFDDGSVTSSHLSYLSMLPYDTVGNPYYDHVNTIAGLEPWHDAVAQIIVPNEAIKWSLYWNDFSLARELNMTACVELKNSSAYDGSCDRLILDGPRGDAPGIESQLVRQVWFYDYKTILLYTVGNLNSPTESDFIAIENYGMSTAVEKVIVELQAAVDDLNITIPMPDWSRAKQWPMGSLCLNWNVTMDGPKFSEAFRRPFGDQVNVWYGNSEMNADESLHGWAEGALSMANTSFPEIQVEFKKAITADFINTLD